MATIKARKQGDGVMRYTAIVRTRRSGKILQFAQKPRQGNSATELAFSLVLASGSPLQASRNAVVRGGYLRHAANELADQMCKPALSVDEQFVGYGMPGG